MKTVIAFILSSGFIYSNSFVRSARGTISDILKDSTGAFQNLASVYLENSNHGASYSSGKFKILNIPLGDYTIMASLIGNETQESKNFRFSLS